jgi:hypothetical protein
MVLLQFSPNLNCFGALLVVKTQFVTKIGHPGDSDDGLFMPVGVTVSQRGDIVVCDMRHNAVKVFSIDGSLLLLIKSEVRDEYFIFRSH